MFVAGALLAEVPNRLTYQGRLARRGVSVVGNHIFVARILGNDDTQLWSSGNITLKLPITGDFAIVLEPNVAVADWLNNRPVLEVSIDGEKFTPNEPFGVSPYAYVAKTVEDGSITNAKLASDLNLDSSKIAVYTDTNSGNVTKLADWRDTTYPWKIKGAAVQGTTLPGNHANEHRTGGTDVLQLAPSQVDGTAIVASTNTTQKIEPSAAVMPLIIKPMTGTNPATVHIADFRDENNASKLFIGGNGNVGIGTNSPSVKLQVVGGVFFSSMTVIRAINASHTQTIPNATEITATFDGEVDLLDEFNMATGVFQPKSSGYYQVSANIGWGTAPASGYSRRVFIYKNSAIYSQNSMPSVAGYTHAQYFSDIVWLDAGDTIDIRVLHERGSNDFIGGDMHFINILRIAGR